MSPSFKYVVMTMIATVLIATGCRKELCFEPYHPHEKQLRVIIDYSQMDYVPEQMRLDFYSITDGSHYMRFVTPTNNIVELPYGLYSLVSFNDNSDFVNIREENQYEKILAYLPKISRSQYNMLYEGKQMRYSSKPSPEASGGEMTTTHPSTGGAEAYTIGQPDLFFVDNLDLIDVKDIDGIQIIHLYPANTTVVYHLHVHVVGMESVLQARGTMSGVSPSIFLHNKQREWINGTVMFDCVRQADGITASVTAFGMIRGGEENPYMTEHNMLNLEFLLKDGTVFTEAYDIVHLLTDDICKNGGTLGLGDLVIHIPQVDTDGGFDVKLEDWYDEETISLE